jgi:hypothetical protein
MCWIAPAGTRLDMGASIRPELHHLRTGALLSATLLTVCSCSAGTTSPAPAPDRPGNIRLAVVNHHWLDVAIYVIHDGQRTRLGMAGGSARTELSLPPRLLGVGRELRLYGDPIGSAEQAMTEPILVQPGQFIEWLLETELGRSTVGVY